MTTTTTMMMMMMVMMMMVMMMMMMVMMMEREKRLRERDLFSFFVSFLRSSLLQSKTPLIKNHN